MSEQMMIFRDNVQKITKFSARLLKFAVGVLYYLYTLYDQSTMRF